MFNSKFCTMNIFTRFNFLFAAPQTDILVFVRVLLGLWIVRSYLISLN